MKIDLSQTLKDRKGEVMKDIVAADEKGKPVYGDPITLASVAYTALTASYDDERLLSREEKLKRGRLAQRILGGDSLDLKAEEVTLLKTCIGKGFGPWIVVQTEDMLEAQPKET